MSIASDMIRGHTETIILRQLLGDDMAAATYLATYVYDNLIHNS